MKKEFYMDENEQVLSLINEIQFSLINISVNIINGFFSEGSRLDFGKIYEDDTNKFEQLSSSMVD